PTVLIIHRLTSFFDSYCGSRSLHSFPTRRSSDLCVGMRAGSAPRAPRQGGGCPLGTPEADSRQRRHAIAACPSARRAGIAFPAADRKSTRLNSSHVKISYAVFCLKKKNTKEMSRS